IAPDAAVGGAIAYNYVGGGFDPTSPDLVNKPSDITDQVTAYIDGSSVDADGNIVVTAGFGAPTTPAELGSLATSTTTLTPGTAVTPSANTIDAGDNSGFATGQPFVYHEGRGITPVGGLTDGTTYYVIKPAGDTPPIKLAAAGDDARTGK